MTEDNKIFIAYSENGKDGEWNVPDAENATADVYEITEEGNVFIGKVEIADKKISLSVNAGQALAIKIN